MHIMQVIYFFIFFFVRLQVRIFSWDKLAFHDNLSLSLSLSQNQHQSLQVSLKELSLDQFSLWSW